MDHHSYQESFFSRTCRALILSVWWMAVAAGCDIGDKIKDPIKEAIAVLDDAIRVIDENSEEWQQALQDALAKLTRDAQSTVRNEISDLLNRGVSAVGGEFRCNLDFVGHRVRYSLLRIRARLLGDELPAQEPGLCNVVPLAIDRALIPERLNHLQFFGYDFDTDQTIRVRLVESHRTVDVSNNLDTPTHYHMTLNLGANGVPLSDRSNKIILEWQQRPISQIAVIQSQPICQTQVTNHSVGQVTYKPPHTRGDREFSGNGPRVNSTVTLLNYGSRVDARIYMQAIETKSDWTEARGSMTKTIYTPDPGKRVQSIIGALTDDVSYTDTGHGVDRIQRGAGGPVREFIFVGDSSGDDAGVRTQVTVDFNRLRLEIVDAGDCIPPGVMETLRTQNLVTPATYARLIGKDGHQP